MTRPNPEFLPPNTLAGMARKAQTHRQLLFLVCQAYAMAISEYEMASITRGELFNRAALISRIQVLEHERLEKVTGLQPPTPVGGTHEPR